MDCTILRLYNTLLQYNPCSEEHSLDTRLAALFPCVFFAHTRNVVCARWLSNAIVAGDFGIANFAISNKWHSATAIGCLWSHGVDAHDHGNNSSVQEEESKNTDADYDVQHDWVLLAPI